jgi:hypothetical protein
MYFTFAVLERTFAVLERTSALLERTSATRGCKIDREARKF